MVCLSLRLCSPGAYGLSQSLAGLVNALPLFIFAVASPLAPWFTKRVGLEKSLFIALLLIAAGYLLRSSGTELGLWVGTA